MEKNVHHAGQSRCRPLLLPVLVAAACASFSAAGQNPAPAEPAAPASATRNPDGTPATPQTVEVLTVTGTRRREPVRDVPVQLNTVPAEQLEQSGARTLTDYLATQPGVDLKTGGGPGFGSVSIRGISTGDATIATVGLYVDDVPFGSSTAYAIGSGTALDMGLLDLNRVEILRGPQGTIYGASTMGGLIKYVTNEPDTTRFSGRALVGGASVGSGSANNTLSAVLNVPLQENTSGLRMAAYREHAGGFVDAVGDAAGSDVNTGNTVGGRLAFVANPLSNLQIKLSATYQDIKRESQDTVDYDAATGSPVNGSLTRKLAIREPYEVKNGVAGLEIDWDLGWARLDSITSGQKTDNTRRVDATYVYGPLLAGFGLDVDRVPIDYNVTVRKQVQEFRLTSPRGIFEWLVGYFYAHEKGTNDQLVSSRFTAGGVAGPNLATVALPSEYTENALFGDITWNPTRALALTAGIRSARNKQSFDQISDGPLVGGATAIHGDSNETTQTYLATARYALTSTSNVYARAASGYRPGGPNAVVNDPATGQPLAPPTFESDSLWSYELGYKADLLQRALSVEAALYDIKWKDLQQISAVNGIGVIVNAGRAKIDGAEVGLRYRPDAQWTLNASYAYINAKLTEDAPGLGQSGARLPNSAKSSATFGATYSFSAAGYASNVGADVRYVGERNAGFEGSGTLPNYKLPDYTLVDLHATMDFRVLQVGLYVRNLADKRAQLGAGTNFVPLGGYVQVNPAQPRTIGVTVSGTFSPLRIFLAALAHETNTFAPLPTTRDSFVEGLLHHRGDAATLDKARQFAGFADVLAIAQARGDECIAGLCAWAQPGGPLPRGDYEALRDELLDDLRAAGKVDFVFLVLHGAMVAEGPYADCEGDILERVRAIVGDATPVGALLDLHGNVSEAMAGSAILVACKEYPHIDYPQRAAELYDLLARSSRDGLRTRTVLRRVPMLGILGTTEEPMRSFVRKMQDLEREPGLLSISAMHGFPWADTPFTSAAMLAVHDAADARSGKHAAHIAGELASELFALRTTAQAKRWPLDEALDLALRESERVHGRPVVIADGSDNPGGGAASDATFVLHALLERGISDAALGMIWDPEAVALARAAGEGSEVLLTFGGKNGPLSGKPVREKVTILKCREDASQRGFGDLRDELGAAVAVRVKGIDVVLNSIRQQVFSPDCFTELGIDPAAKRFVVVKSTQHFRAHFDPIAGATVYCDAPGALNANLAALPYRHLRRPIWPIDAVAS